MTASAHFRYSPFSKDQNGSTHSKEEEETLLRQLAGTQSDEVCCLSVSLSVSVCAGTASYSPPVLCILCTKRLLCYVFVACFCFIRLAMSIAPPHYLLPLGLFFGECGVEPSCIPYRVDRPTSRCGPAECEMSIVWDCSAGVKGQMEALCEVAGVCIKFCIS